MEKLKLIGYQSLGFLQFFLQKTNTFSQLLFAWQGIFYFNVVISRNSHWSANSLERPLNINLIHIGTDQKSYCRVVIVGFQQFINGIYIIVQFSRIFWFKWLCFQFADNLTTQTYMIKQQVYLACAVANDKFFLSPDKSKPSAHFEQKICDILCERFLQLCFIIFFVVNCRKAKIIVFLQHFLNKFALY